MKPKTYRINECFHSLQGEGVRAGTAHVFVRFSKCNLRCKRDSEGFDCDTEFESGRDWSLDELIQLIKETGKGTKWVLFTGGEPTLQLDQPLISRLKMLGYSLAIETNGLKEVPEGLDWICVSPKTAEHTLQQKRADEVKYVRAKGMGIPLPSIKADHYLLSPAFEGNYLSTENLEWCIKLIKENPDWSLSVQQHKIWGIR